MRIAIPTENETLQSVVCVSFGRTPYFAVIDMDANTTEFIENTAVHQQGGAGIWAAQLLVDQNVAVVITPRCGENAQDVLKGADISIYKSIKASLAENLKAFTEEKLDVLVDVQPGHHGQHSVQGHHGNGGPVV